MIIGISGKIGSGKDLVGNIIQYLIWYDINKNNEYVHQISAEDIVTSDMMFVPKGMRGFISVRNESGFVIKKFADKLKDIVCLLIGCTRQQLEDRNFKNQELGEEWRVWYFQEKKIRIPNNFYGIFSSEREAWSFINTNMIHNLTIHSEVLTPRKILQLLGTQCGRQIIHPNIWINALFADYKLSEDYQVGTTPENLKWVDGEYPNWIITDTRFPNEIQAIEKRNGLTIRVNRALVDRFPNHWREFQPTSMNLSDYVFIEWLRTHSNIEYRELGESLIHESETALDDYEGFDYIIENDEDIFSLIEKVREILKNEKIIS